MLIEDRARLEMTSFLATDVRICERLYGPGEISRDAVGKPFVDQDLGGMLAYGPHEQRHVEMGKWWLLKRRINFDVAVDVVTNVVKSRIKRGECEDAAFHTAMWMFEWWMNEWYDEEPVTVPVFAEWMDDTYYELDLDWEHSLCNPNRAGLG